MMVWALSMSPTLSRTTSPARKAAAIGEREQHAKPEGLGDREQAFGLVGADHQRDLLGLTDVVDVGAEIQSPQCHPEQEPEPGHRAVAV